MILHGQEVLFPAATAAEWLSVLMVQPPDLDEIVRLMSPQGLGLLFDESVGEELYEGILDVITVISGRPWFVALRLIGVAQDNWNVLGGEMLLKGVRADQMSLSAWLDVLLLVALRAMDPKDVMMFTLQLEKPPPSPGDEESQGFDELPPMDRNAFLSMG